MAATNSFLVLEGRQGRAGQGRAGQGRAGQGRAGQGRAGQGKRVHQLVFKAGQGRANELVAATNSFLVLEGQGRAPNKAG